MYELEEALDQYDLLWREGAQPPQIDEYLQHAGLDEPARAAALPELIAIDMEYRWRSEDPSTAAEIAGETAVALATEDTTPANDSRPRVESYAKRWPQILGDDAARWDLIAEEYRIRNRWGDGPAIADYIARFGESRQLREALEKVHLELELDQAVGEANSAFVSNLESTLAELSIAPFAAAAESFVGSLESTAKPRFGRYRILKRLGQGGMGESRRTMARSSSPPTIPNSRLPCGETEISLMSSASIEER